MGLQRRAIVVPTLVGTLVGVLVGACAPPAHLPAAAVTPRELCEAVEETRENVRYLPGVRLPDGLRCTHDLGAALSGAKWVVFAVPSHAMRAVARSAADHLRSAAPVCVSASRARCCRRGRRGRKIEAAEK